MITKELKRELIKEKNPRIARKLTDEQIDSVIEEAEKVRFNKTKIAVEFNTETESDILSYVLAQCNKSGYIKELIRNDMIKNN